MAAADRISGVAARTYRAGEAWLIDAKRATYGVAVARIGYGVVVVGFVVANFPVRDFIWGPGSGWVKPIQYQTAWSFPFDFYSSADPEWLFTIKFLLLGVAGLALLLGWHSRISAIVTLYLYISLVSTNPVAYDQTDNAFRILLFYFCFTDMSARWSLDARRRARRAAVSPSARRLPVWFPTILHNGALVAVALQLFIIYGVAGMAKVAGSQWADGTAVYYPLQLDSLDPWPGLAQLVTVNPLVVNIATYVSVYVEVFFAFLLLTRWTRILALSGILSMHVGIAVLMGLPFFSLSMMAADAIFIRDRTYATAQRYVHERIRPRFTPRHRTPQPKPSNRPSGSTTGIAR
ncbi:HTTM domain-containing protein [Rathayibacter soli]|uniref:HTTM domain-containing protein n=1 Tax=Rathayibacter soli TaxID=3144168 RepID=UPI0027E4DF5F|nr:HTTM domain-containing protein [Glaciibacter superstes]